MAVFDFPYHRLVTKYPESSKRLQFGRSYQFVARPEAPDQRIFELQFEYMKWYVNSDGTLDTTTNAKWNAGALDAFYQTHRLYEIFQYPHEFDGELNVRFNKPLELPASMFNAQGGIPPFKVELIEQP